MDGISILGRLFAVFLTVYNSILYSRKERDNFSVSVTQKYNTMTKSGSAGRHKAGRHKV